MPDIDGFMLVEEKQRHPVSVAGHAIAAPAELFEAAAGVLSRRDHWNGREQTYVAFA
jgi:hypothetical protein